MVEIPEFKRDDSRDYQKILRALLEIPFPVGRNLLVDFLQGRYKNPSIIKNKLDELVHFGVLQSWDAAEITSLVDTFIARNMIEQVLLEGNSFAKVLRITTKGKQELVTPTMHEPLEPVMAPAATTISDWDRKVFVQYADFLVGLNDEQKKAVVSPSSRILTIAGAGTGKTSVLVKRIAFLVRHRGIDPTEILAITFTRKAREEMERRLAELGIQGVVVATFNSFAERILRRHSQELYGRRMRVLTFADKHLALNLALYHHNLELAFVLDLYFSKTMQRARSPQQLHNQFMYDCFSLLDYFRLTGTELYDFSKDADPEYQQVAQLVYKIVVYLDSYKRDQGLRSFSDQLIDVVSAFSRRPAIIPYYAHVLVDEYQDVNAVQVSILQHLNFDNLFAVGDPRQAIYGWRGSDHRFIQGFENDFGEAEHIHLVKNYRSNEHLVSFMNTAIRHMQLPDLSSHDTAPGTLKLFSFATEDAEREFVVQALESVLKPGERVFILARTNRQIQELAGVLTRKRIPFLLKTDDSAGSAHTNDSDVLPPLVLATVHAIKGLEADVVFLLGVNKDSFPCRASDHPVIECIKDAQYDKYEEEKRLFYVAISRARRELYLTYTGSQTEFITREMEGFL